MANDEVVANGGNWSHVHHYYVQSATVFGSLTDQFRLLSWFQFQVIASLAYNAWLGFSQPVSL